MTLKQLIKKLQKIDNENPKKRLKVSIDLKAASEKYNDCFNVVDVSGFRIDFVEMGDGDGFGTDKYHEMLLIN